MTNKRSLEIRRTWHVSPKSTFQESKVATKSVFCYFLVKAKEITSWRMNQVYFRSISKKWMQLISFIAMVLIFLSVVTCSPSDTEGVCQYRDEAMVGGAGLMMALFGLKIAQRKKNKPNQKLKSTWEQWLFIIFIFNTQFCCSNFQLFDYVILRKPNKSIFSLIKYAAKNNNL